MLRSWLPIYLVYTQSRYFVTERQVWVEWMWHTIPTFVVVFNLSYITCVITLVFYYYHCLFSQTMHTHYSTCYFESSFNCVMISLSFAFFSSSTTHSLSKIDCNTNVLLLIFRGRGGWFFISAASICIPF